MPTPIRNFSTASSILSEALQTRAIVRDNPHAGRPGQLDPQDTYEVFSHGARTAGKTIGVDLFNDVAFRARVVEAAYALDRSGASFSQRSDTDKVNDTLWRLDYGGTMYVRKFLRDGTLGSPARALRDIFENGHQYGFECAASMMVILHKAILDTVGDQAFDAMFTEPRYFRIFRWDEKDADYLDLEVMDETKNDLVPGNHYYYKNPGVADQHAAFAGENVIYLGTKDGERLFYAHGVVGDRGGYIVSERELLNSLRALRNAGSNEEPYRVNFTYSINTQKLAQKARDYDA